MYTLGIDIGSTSSKTVILEDGIKIAAHVVIPLGTGTIGPETHWTRFSGSPESPKTRSHTP